MVIVLLALKLDAISYMLVDVAWLEVEFFMLDI